MHVIVLSEMKDTVKCEVFTFGGINDRVDLFY